MDAEQLRAALSRHGTDPDAVMAAFRAKRHRRARNRHLVLGGGLAVACLAVAAVVLQPWAAGQPRPAGTPGPAAAGGCASVSLPQTLATARRDGASVIVATGSLTGRTATDGEVYHQMVLRSVRTLSGPPVAPGATGWAGSSRGPAGPVPGADAGTLWGTDGRLFAIAWPAKVTGTTVGPILRIAPVTGGSVIFSSAGCWDSTGLSTRPYHGPLAEIPGSNSYARAAPGGFHAAALSAVERLVSRSRGT